MEFTLNTKQTQLSKMDRIFIFIKDSFLETTRTGLVCNGVKIVYLLDSSSTILTFHMLKLSFFITTVIFMLVQFLTTKETEEECYFNRSRKITNFINIKLPKNIVIMRLL